MVSEIPKHVALIMDGNRRWAKSRNLHTVEGHKKGKNKIEPIVFRCKELGIYAVSFYTLSRENLKRPKSEIDPLLNAVSEGITPMLDRLAKENIRFVPLGDLDLFPLELHGKIALATEQTKTNTSMTVNLALGYDGRDEIVRAFRKLNDEGISSSLVTEELISSKLDTRGQPDPDLVIRTGGRSRLSGYLPWQSAYSEIYFSKTLWPDFEVEEFNTILTWYSQQVKTFGK